RDQVVGAVDPEVQAQAQRQRIDADRVLDQAIGGGQVQAAALERLQIVVAQLGALAQLVPAGIEGQTVKAGDSRVLLGHLRVSLLGQLHRAGQAALGPQLVDLNV